MRIFLVVCLALLTAGCPEFASPTDPMLNWEFWSLDCDGNGALSFEELSQFEWKRALEGQISPINISDFNGADEDSDGVLTVVEFTRLTNRDGYFHYSPRPNCH